ncbi:MAG TPA: isoprenylcysteine carboxylmethyltransferase family protein [Flavitalea sp.]|nr:isoprenylcysteine carboxylmethyltransferase family protein [Flavitalea sp.]
MNISQHWWLAAVWTTYCILHSVFAASWWKKWAGIQLGKGYRYYRPGYSVFAALSLVGILIYQFSIPSPDIVVMPGYIKLVAVPVGVVGLVFMWKSIRKYFFYLSGIDVVINKPVESRLETGGLHKLVRHPLYFGTLTVIWCLFAWMPSFANAIAALLITIYTLIGIRIEEHKLVAEFGDAYRGYQKEVSMIVPGLRKRKSSKDPVAQDS